MNNHQINKAYSQLLDEAYDQLLNEYEDTVIDTIRTIKSEYIYTQHVTGVHINCYTISHPSDSCRFMKKFRKEFGGNNVTNMESIQKILPLESLLSYIDNCIPHIVLQKIEGLRGLTIIIETDVKERESYVYVIN